MRIVTVMAAAALMMAAGSARAQNVSYDYDMDANFQGYRTYAWVPGHNLEDAFNHKRIVAAVDSQLSLKGLRRVETSDKPDVLVAYHASFTRNLRVTGFSSGWGGYRFANRTATARAEEILIGTLVVDLMQASEKTIIWRGTIIKEVTPQAGPEKREKNINKAVEKLFKAYPPKR
jgi:Domain of unknown function (DUF4136)